MDLPGRAERRRIIHPPSLVTGRLAPDSGSPVPARDAAVCGPGLDMPSPGETRKLLFARAPLRGVSAVPLDEPTNHMDPGSAACFAEALADFEGAVVLVTHDEALAGRVAAERWRLERDGIRAVLAVTGGEGPT